MPGRPRPATASAVRHRAGRSARRAGTGRAGPDGRAAVGYLAGQGTQRRRLVAPTAPPRAGWTTPPWTSRSWSTSATRWRRCCAPTGSWNGRNRSSPPSPHSGRPPLREDPWRRTSGIHRISDRRTLAAIRELWTVRDDVARRRDLAPHRVLPDSAIIAAATCATEDRSAAVRARRVLRSAPAPAGRHLAVGPRPGASCAGLRPAAGAAAGHRTAAGAALGDQGPGRRGPAGRRPRGADGAVRAGLGARGEPGPAGTRPARAVAASRSRRGPAGAGRRRRPALADRSGGPDPLGGDRAARGRPARLLADGQAQAAPGGGQVPAT